MGLLDDAIKEHLELKRRRGADPGEIARQETEALGPVRRGEVDLADRPPMVADPGELDAYETEAELEPAPESGVAAESLFQRPDDEAGDQPAEEPDATRQFSADEVQEALAADQEPDVVPADGEGDVLEETPDFLEETPEHDRLWFEQKPPKDFDFDD
jgi:hypothetical protein